jgi:hypothetical protein
MTIKINNQPGYILLLTIMILSLSTIVVTQIFFQARLYNSFIPLMVEKEKARQLALSGVSIAIAQLSLHDARFEKQKDQKLGKPEEKKDQKNTAEESVDHAKNLLRTVLSVQGRWQTFVLKHDVDGIDAQLNVCITCEDGKLNVNSLYDFEKHEFKKIAQASPEELFKQLGEASKPLTANKNMFEPIQDFLKKQEAPLVDVTQLLQGKALDDFKEHLFYSPSKPPVVVEQDLKEEKEEEKKPTIFLADLFTISTDSHRISPWVLSSSLQLLFKIKPREMVSEKDFEKEIDELVEKVSIDKVSWQKDWNTYLKPLYKVDFESLPKELIPFLSTKFEPRQFSVLCYGKVGRITQKLLVILERTATGEGESFLMKKIYWL